MKGELPLSFWQKVEILAWYVQDHYPDRVSAAIAYLRTLDATIAEQVAARCSPPPPESPTGRTS